VGVELLKLHTPYGQSQKMGWEQHTSAKIKHTILDVLAMAMTLRFHVFFPPCFGLPRTTLRWCGPKIYLETERFGLETFGKNVATLNAGVPT